MAKQEKYSLSEEGMRYLKEGLPEENLVRLGKDRIPISEARRRIHNFHIALLWAKKKDWVKLDGGRIIILKRPERVEEHEALKKIRSGEQVGEGMISVLITRNLVRKEKDDAFRKAEKMIGKEITNLTPELIKTGLWKKTKLKPYNIRITGEKLYPGKRQPYNRFLSQVRQKLVEMGFREMSGPTIETEFWNFDALFQAQNHPSRDWTQTYSLRSPKHGDLPDRRIVEHVRAAHENGWKTGSTGWRYKWDPMKAAQLMPRAHGTALSARTLASKPVIPGKYFAIVRCFRPDVIDSTHGVEFNQTEGIVIGDSMNFRHLLGLLREFAVEFAGAEKVKFNTDYYPFTEPSVQLSAKHPEMGWIEFAGAGIFRPEFTMAMGVEEPVLAWGLGVDRLAMFRLGINDIRYLFSQDLEWLRKQKVTV